MELRVVVHAGACAAGGDASSVHAALRAACVPADDVTHACLRGNDGAQNACMRPHGCVRPVSEGLTLFRTRSAPLRRHVDVCRNHAYQPSPSRRLEKAQQDTAVAAHFAVWRGCLFFRGLTREGGRQRPAPDLDPRAACLTSSKALD